MLTKTDDAEDGPIYSVPPVVRAIKVLRYIAAGGSVANQSRAAREIGINRTTLLRILHTLEAEALIERRGSSDEYALGPGMIELAGSTLNSMDVVQAARPVLRRMAAELGLCCHMALLQGREVLYVARATPEAPLLSNIRIGTRMPAHASSMGRAILSATPAAAVEALFRDVVLEAVTQQTPTSFEALRSQLDEIAGSGNVVDARSAFESGVDSIAVPVFDMSGDVVAAINASGPSNSFETPVGRRDVIALTVKAGAAEISRRLGYSGAAVTR